MGGLQKLPLYKKLIYKFRTCGNNDNKPFINSVNIVRTLVNPGSKPKFFLSFSVSALDAWSKLKHFNLNSGLEAFLAWGKFYLIISYFQNNLQSELEDKLNSTIHSMKMERDELELKKDQEISNLKRFTEKLQRERDDSTLRFEEEKHRSMMIGGSSYMDILCVYRVFNNL